MKPSLTNRTCLHLVVQYSCEALKNCHSHLAPGDVVLFLDDGVMAITKDNKEVLHFLNAGEWGSSTRFSAVDLEARGLSGLAGSAGAAMLTDAQITDLLQTCDFCVTWK